MLHMPMPAYMLAASMLPHAAYDANMLSTCNTGLVVTPEAEVESLDGEAILVVQLAGQLQVEGGLAGRTLHAHLGHWLRPHVWRIEHIP